MLQRGTDLLDRCGDRIVVGDVDDHRADEVTELADELVGILKTANASEHLRSLALRGLLAAAASSACNVPRSPV